MMLTTGSQLNKCGPQFHACDSSFSVEFHHVEEYFRLEPPYARTSRLNKTELGSLHEGVHHFVIRFVRLPRDKNLRQNYRCESKPFLSQQCRLYLGEISPDKMLQVRINKGYHREEQQTRMRKK